MARRQAKREAQAKAKGQTQQASNNPASIDPSALAATDSTDVSNASSRSSSSASASTSCPLPSPTPPEEARQAQLLEVFSQPLTVPDSPVEQARRMSLAPTSRRNSLMSIPPPPPDIKVTLDHTPKPGEDYAIDPNELQKELEEIDTIG